MTPLKNSPTVCFTDFLVIWLEAQANFATACAPAASKNEARFKSGQKMTQNYHHASLI